MSPKFNAAENAAKGTASVADSALATNEISDLEFKQHAIYTTIPKIIQDGLFEHIQEGIFDLEDFDGNMVTMAMMMLEQMAVIVSALEILERQDRRNKIKQEFNLQMRGIERKLELDLMTAKTQYAKGKVDIKTAQYMMQLAQTQFALQSAAAVMKGIGQALAMAMPTQGATATIAGGIAEAGANFASNTIQAIQLINQGQNSMLDSMITKYNAEATAVQTFYQASASMVASEQQLMQALAQALGQMREGIASALGALASQQYLHLIV
jgi:hypothetical protein